MDTILLTESSYYLRRRSRKRRAFWISDIVEKREKLGEFHHLFDDLKNSEEKFFNYYRMNRSTFEYILSKINSTVTKTSNFRETISPAERLTVTLRYLETGSSFQTLGYSFRMSDVTVGRIVHETCQAIWDNLYTKHMPFPAGDCLSSIRDQFWDKWKFPNCVGCIDGKHIRTKCPYHSGSTYRNYKQYFSIVLQADAGPDYKFIAIDVGAYGKQSDGGIFLHSNLYKKLEEGALNTTIQNPLPGTDITVPHVLLGDEAYPLKTYLMRPYPMTKLGPREEIFNERLSRAPQVVECAFGIMTSKWRILQKAIEVTPDHVDTIVKCICLLHNIVIDGQGEEFMTLFSHSGRNTVSNRPRFSTIGENRGSSSAYIIRDKFKAYFCSGESN